ncbi:hypothetical protein P2H44_09245 [Albimonas sp. CAU 1670]|uniref:hypothetical protein n=1 Tax=Albimonas sp. CAU 1670 TaxID=3032599 RepID=UPI0023DB0AAC|nr:hypothetical protein [Albimonas sp. CAU 1670]MDF2232736.1 hypothetical protein [Albimonas sp. CAU 1670]
MAKLLILAAVAVAALVPAIGTGEDETWLNVGRLRGLDISVAPDFAYVDEQAETFSIPARLHGEMDARTRALPHYEHEPPVVPAGTRTVELTYVFHCDTGATASVMVHAGYDAEWRRLPLPDSYIAFLESAILTGMRAVDTEEALQRRREFCARIRPAVSDLRKSSDLRI